MAPASMVISPWLPKMRVRRGPAAVKAVAVNAAVVPSSYSMFTTWWSTTSLSEK